MVYRVLGMLLAVCLLVALLVYSQWRLEPNKVSGFIEADEIRLGSRVGGRVARVHVVEGQGVQPGTELVTLEPFDLEQREAEAAAQLAGREQELKRLETGFRAEEIAQSKERHRQLQAKYDLLKAGARAQEIAAADARLLVALAQLQLAEQSYTRMKATFERNAATQNDMDRAVQELKSAQGTKLVREQELELLKAGAREQEMEHAAAALAEAAEALKLVQAGYRAEEVSQARAARDAARAALNAIHIQQAELVIKSPVAGAVESLELQPGDLVGPSAPVLSLVDLSHLWVRAYVPENRVALRKGERLKVSIDSFPGETFEGEVTFIARQAEFTPSNVQTPDERAKQVFRMKVELRGGGERLRPGMAADVWLE